MTDNKSILLGASDDFRIRHTGSHSEITDEGTGNLRLGSNQVIIGSPTFDETSAKFVDDGAVELYHNGNKKFSTHQYGVDIDGNVYIGDSGEGKLLIGDGDDLQIYHDGSESVIGNGTGTLQILSPNEIKYRGTTHHFLSYANDETMAKFNDDGAVELYYDSSKKLRL